MAMHWILLIPGLLFIVGCRDERGPASAQGADSVSPYSYPPQGVVFEIVEFEVTHVDPSMPPSRKHERLSVWEDGRIGEYLVRVYHGGIKGSPSQLSPRRLAELTSQARCFATRARCHTQTLKLGDKCTVFGYFHDRDPVRLRFVNEIPRELLELREALRAELTDATNKWRLATKRRVASRSRASGRLQTHLKRLRERGLLEQFVREGLIPSGVAYLPEGAGLPSLSSEEQGNPAGQ